MENQQCRSLGHICPVLFKPEVERALLGATPDDIPNLVVRTEGRHDKILFGVYGFHAIWLQNGRRVYDLAEGVAERLMSVDPQWGSTPFTGVIRLRTPIWNEHASGKKLGMVAFYVCYHLIPDTDLEASGWSVAIVPQFIDQDGDDYWGAILRYYEHRAIQEDDLRIARLMLNVVYALTNERVGRIVPMTLSYKERRARQKIGQYLACRRLELPVSAHHVFTTVRDVVRPTEPPPPPPEVVQAEEAPTERSAAVILPHQGLRWMLEGHCSESDVLSAIDQDRVQERPGKPMLIGVPRPIKGHVRGQGQIKSRAAHVVLAKE